MPFRDVPPLRRPWWKERVDVILTAVPWSGLGWGGLIFAVVLGMVRAGPAVVVDRYRGRGGRVRLAPPNHRPRRDHRSKPRRLHRHRPHLERLPGANGRGGDDMTGVIAAWRDKWCPSPAHTPPHAASPERSRDEG